MMLAEVGTYIQANNLGTLGTDLFRSLLPDTPDVAAALYEYGGSVEFVHDVQGVAYEQPGLQVVCRGAPFDYDTPRGQAEAIYRLLSQVVNQTLSGTRYRRILPMAPPFVRGRDYKDRVEIAINFHVDKVPS